MKVAWHGVLSPPLLVSARILLASQYVFIKGSFFADLGVGRLGSELTRENYRMIVADEF